MELRAYLRVGGEVRSTSTLSITDVDLPPIVACRSKVPYPDMYAHGKDEASLMFNCIQRAHQNTLETLPAVLAMQILMGMVFPVTSAALGAGWSIGRFPWTFFLGLKPVICVHHFMNAKPRSTLNTGKHCMNAHQFTRRLSLLQDASSIVGVTALATLTSVSLVP